MRKAILAAFLLACVMTQARAESFEITLSPSPKNMVACSAGDSTWAKKWVVIVDGDNVTAGAATTIKLKRASDGTFTETLRFGSSGTFNITYAVSESGRSLTVTNKALGCVWQGPGP